MAQQIIKENKMLKELVSALEKQNDSRNLERDTLVRQIDRLSEENDILRDQLKKSNKNTENSNQISNLMRTKKQTQKNLFEVQNHLQHALNHQSIIESQNEKLRIEVQNLNNKLKGTPTKNQFESNEKEIKRLKLENEELKKKACLIQNIQKQASTLQKQNIRLKQNISQLKSNELYKEQQLQQRISQFRNAQSQQIRQIVKKQSEKEKNQEIAQLRTNYQLMMKNKDQLLRQLQSKLNAANIKVFQNENNSTLQMRQLRLSKNDLQNKLNVLQNQKKWMQKKIKQLELQSSHQHNLINQKQIQNSQLDDMRMNVEKKQQQLSRCQTVIDALNQNIVLLQNMVRQLQIQLQNFKLRAKDINRQQLIQTEQKYRNEIIKLKQQLSSQQRIYPQMLEQQKKYSVEKERENLQLKKILSELSENNKNLLAKIKFSQCQQKEQPAPEVGQKLRLDSNDSQLRNIVQELRQELKQVKSNFKRIENDNRKMESLVHSKTVESEPINEIRSFGYINSKFINNEQNYKSRQKSRLSTKNIQQFNQKYPLNYPLIHAEQEEPKVKVTKLDKLVEKSRVISGDGNSKAMHRDKWHMLQKRINQLRQENEELKHSLYS